MWLFAIGYNSLWGYVLRTAFHQGLEDLWSQNTFRCILTYSCQRSWCGRLRRWPGWDPYPSSWEQGLPEAWGGWSSFLNSPCKRLDLWRNSQGGQFRNPRSVSCNLLLWVTSTVEVNCQGIVNWYSCLQKLLAAPTKTWTYAFRVIQ